MLRERKERCERKKQGGARERMKNVEDRKDKNNATKKRDKVGLVRVMK